MTTLPLPPGQTARTWQLEAVAAIRAAAQAGLRQVIVTAATGTGKGTLLAGLARAAERRRVLVLVHRDELIRDLVERIRRVPGGAVGVVRGPENGIAAPIVVASVQTLRGQRLAQVGRFGLVVTDECHHATAPTYQAIYERVNGVRKIHGEGPVVHVGLTATPFRTGPAGSVAGLGEAFEAIVYEHGIVEAIAAGDLVAPLAVRVDTQVRLDGVALKGRDYDPDELAKLIDHPERNAAVARWWRENGAGRPFLGFAVSVAHAERLAAALQGEGARAEAVHGSMPMRERRRLVRAYQSGELDGLVSMALLFEGFDAPRTELLLAVRPTQSPIIARQLVGRGLRLHPGKTSCLVADFVGFLDGLDLGMTVGLEGEGAAAQPTAPRPLAPGDLVVHRYEAARGVGQIVACDEILATVAWGLSDGAPRGRGRHGLAELARAPRAAADEVSVPLVVSGQSERLVHLLPSGGDRGWVELDGQWVASARGRDGGSLHAVVAQRSAGWVLWLARRTREGATAAQAERQHGQVRYRPGAAGRIELMRLGERRLAEAGALPTDLDAGWRAEPATESDRMAVRAAGLRRDLAGLSRGEAVGLIGAAWGRGAVADEIKRMRREYAGGGSYGRGA